MATGGRSTAKLILRTNSRATSSSPLQAIGCALVEEVLNPCMKEADANNTNMIDTYDPVTLLVYHFG